MGKIKNAEKTKDRFLNGALFASLILLASGLARPSSLTHTNKPEPPAYGVFQLQPMTLRDSSIYEQIQPIVANGSPNNGAQIPGSKSNLLVSGQSKKVKMDSNLTSVVPAPASQLPISAANVKVPTQVLNNALNSAASVVGIRTHNL